jgi:quercetin dioxygenase-like cupin family protein
MSSIVGDSVAQALQVRAGRRQVWWIDSTLDVRLTAAETDGQLGLWLWEAQRGAASPLHVHHREDEQFLLIDGTARFRVGEQWLDARAGDAIVLPRNVPHAYVITSETARVVGSVTPGGMEAFFTDLGTPVLPGQPAGPPPTIDAMVAGAGRYGIEILGPPPSID